MHAGLRVAEADKALRSYWGKGMAQREEGFGVGEGGRGCASLTALARVAT